MPSILRTVGGQFRLIGTLATANAIVNPSFEADTTSWDTVGVGVTLNLDSSKAKFGTSSCRVDVPSGAFRPNYYGLKQSLVETPSPGATYTLSVWFFIPSDLPVSGGNRTYPVAAVSYYDNDDALLVVHRTQLTVGTATPDWTKASFLETDVPDNTNRAEVEISTYPADAVSSPAYSIYVDGLRWVAGTEDDFVDGDFAGYVWSGDRFDSTTLTSTAPDALQFFRTSPPTPVIS